MLPNVIADRTKPQALEAVIDHLIKSFPLEYFKTVSTDELRFMQGQQSVIDHLVALAAQEEE